MTTTPIKIIDKPCGSGKTTAMIEGFEPEKKYLVIVPLLTEVHRIIDQSTRVEFVQPDEYDTSIGTKYASLEKHLINGRNVVSTHQLYEDLVPLAKVGLLASYHIIIDEVPQVIDAELDKSQTSIDCFYIETGFMKVVGGSGLVRPTQKWIEAQNDVSDTLSPKILKSAMTDCLYLQDNSAFLRVLPQPLLEVGLSFTVMTYKAEGSMLVAYLRKLGLPFVIERDNELEKKFRGKAAELVTVEDISAISSSTKPKISLSVSQQRKGMRSKSYCSKVSTALKNLRGRKLQNVDAENILITCVKDAWKREVSNKAANDNKYKPGPFAKNSRLWEANWIPNTTRGTNLYAHCSHLIYLFDQYPNPFITKWLGTCSKEFADAYALTELIQWVWRSRVRRGESVTLYLPSLRMRTLFEEWLCGN